MLRLALSGAIPVAALGVAWVGRRLGRAGVTPAMLFAALGLEGTLWMPEAFVSPTVPRIVSGILLGLVAIGGLVELTSSSARLARVRRARAGAGRPTQVGRDLEAFGPAYPIDPLSAPGVDQPCALWTAKHGATTRPSEPLVELRTADGPVLLAPKGAELELSGKVATLGGEAAKLLALKLELGAASGSPPSVEIRWVDVGAPLYALGRAVAEAAPSGLASSSYRGAPAVPVLRSREGARTYVTDRPPAEVVSQARWNRIAWATWGALCAATAAVQLLGWA